MFGKNKKAATLEFFVIFDSKAQSYENPIPEVNANVLKRELLAIFQNPENQQKNKYYRNAEDFSVFRCGSFDCTTGLITSCNLEHVVNLHDLKALVQPARRDEVSGALLDT